VAVRAGVLSGSSSRGLPVRFELAMLVSAGIVPANFMPMFSACFWIVSSRFGGIMLPTR